MSLWCQMSHKDGQELANALSACRPFVGRTVKVASGRKHKGKVGVVFWHGRDTFSDAFRYGDSYQHAAMEVMGRYGYRVGIKDYEGNKFFVPADNVIVSIE